MFHDGRKMNVEGPQWMGVKPKAQARCIGLKGIAVAFIEASLARVFVPIGTGDAERKLDKAILGRAVRKEWQEVTRNLVNVMPGEGVTHCKA